MLKFPDTPMRLGLAVLLFATSASSGSAALASSATAATGVLGNWCALDGSERLLIEETGVGFNEHTICDMKDPLALTSLVKSELSCANVYFDGDEVFRVFEKTLAFRAQLTENDQLEVTLREEGEPPKSLRYQRCDN